MIPDQARGNTNSGDINYTLDRNNFSFYKVSIKREYAKIIDDYFSRQGYKVNTIKTPNFTGRPYWNFIQIGNEENIGYIVYDKSLILNDSDDYNYLDVQFVNGSYYPSYYFTKKITDDNFNNISCIYIIYANTKNRKETKSNRVDGDNDYINNVLQCACLSNI